MAIDSKESWKDFAAAPKEKHFSNCRKMPGDLMSALTIAFRTEQDHRIRALLIKVAWHVEIRKTIALLAEAIN